MAFTPISAKNAKVRYGGGPTTFTAKTWNVDSECPALDTTNTESAGFFTCIGSIKKCSVTIEADFDSAQDPFDNSIQVGNTLTNLKLYLNDLSGPFWLFPSFYIEKTPNKADVKSTVGVNFSGYGTATFTYPTG